MYLYIDLKRHITKIKLTLKVTFNNDNNQQMTSGQLAHLGHFKFNLDGKPVVIASPGSDLELVPARTNIHCNWAAT